MLCLSCDCTETAAAVFVFVGVRHNGSFDVQVFNDSQRLVRVCGNHTQGVESAPEQKTEESADVVFTRDLEVRDRMTLSVKFAAEVRRFRCHRRQIFVFRLFHTEPVADGYPIDSAEIDVRRQLCVGIETASVDRVTEPFQFLRSTDHVILAFLRGLLCRQRRSKQYQKEKNRKKFYRIFAPHNNASNFPGKSTPSIVTIVYNERDETYTKYKICKL